MPFNNNVNQQNDEIEHSQGSENLSAMNTPTKDQQVESSPAQLTPNSSEGSPGTLNSGSAGGKQKNKYRRQLGSDGQPKKNFYNPPGKVMRHLAQQSYYDNFYGN